MLLTVRALSLAPSTVNFKYNAKHGMHVFSTIYKMAVPPTICGNEVYQCNKPRKNRHRV